MNEPKIKCEHCGDLSDRLNRNNSGEKWLCPPCYIGQNCFPTPQTLWATEENNHIIEAMKKIAKNDNDIAEVMKNLSVEEKIARAKKLYDVEEVLEIIGYYDNTLDETHRMALKDVEYDSNDTERIAYSIAINNGNFEVAIACNKR